MIVPTGRTTALALAAALALGPLAACSSPAAPGGGTTASAPASGATPPDTTSPSASAPEAPPAEEVERAFAELEARYGARVGVHAVDTGSERTVAHRADERFAHASTFKALAAAVVLSRTTEAELDAVVPFTSADLVTYSPVTEGRAGTGMTLREIGAAAVTVSDNTAGNLLLRQIGGPSALDAALAELGDDVTSVDRDETELNTAVPGDARDTSTPAALAADLRAFAVDDALAEEDRAVLTAWLRESTTGSGLVRAAVPEGWDVGDKSGTGGYGTRNDVAVVWPPGREPLVIAVLTTREQEGAEPDDALVAAAARIALDALG